MKITEMINKETGERLITFGGEDFECVQPAKYYYEHCLISKMRLLEPEVLSGKKRADEQNVETLLKTAEYCRAHIDKFLKIRVHENLIKLLYSKKKKEQIKLLKGIRLTPDTMMALILEAEKQGYLLSQYSSEHYPDSIDLDKMPMAYTLKEDGTIKIIGTTELTPGQLKQALEQRSVIVAKILEKGEEWHCFFLTYKSIGGKESWQKNQPHYHYISSQFGISKQNLLKQIKSKNYKLGNLPHIALDDYGIQPDEKVSP